MTRRSWVAAAVVLGGSAVGCSLLPDLDDLSGGKGSTSDASLDGPRDAQPDGPDGGRFCASLSPTPSFCDDFDDPGPLAAKWDGVFVRAGGTVVRDGADFRSAPSSLLATSPPTNTASSAQVYVASVTPKGRVRVAYDIKVESRDSKSKYAETEYVSFEGSGFKFASYLQLNSDPGVATQVAIEAYLADGGIPSHNVTLQGARFDKWTRVEVTIDVASTPHLLSVSVDGEKAGSVVLESDQYGPGPVKVKPGIGYTDSPSVDDWRIRYDNVTIDWQ